MEAWSDWVSEHLIMGETREAKALEGKIQFLDSNNKEIAEIRLHNVGPISLEESCWQDRKRPDFATFTVKLYNESMSFNYNVFGL
jgi:hypothetical protein